jgi:hypothetical protein
MKIQPYITMHAKKAKNNKLFSVNYTGSSEFWKYFEEKYISAIEQTGVSGTNWGQEKAVKTPCLIANYIPGCDLY